MKSYIQSLGFVVSLPAGTTDGAVQAGGDIFTGLTKGCYNGNSLDNTLRIMDSGVKGCGKGYAVGSVKGFGSFEKINFWLIN